MTSRQIFLNHLAQTSESPLCFELNRAEDVFLYDVNDKKYIDLIGGISVCNVGHCNQEVKMAIQRQLEKYMHVMVYGELIQSPQIQYAKALAEHLPENLQSVYFTNSGAEATEGAMKLAKRVTKRSKIISFKNAYHGSTQGALSVIGSEYFQQAYRPLLPNVFMYEYGRQAAIDAIDNETACVILEPVQSEAGVIIPANEWLQKLKQKCVETGCLLIFDEIQSGFGRTGSLFRFTTVGVVPDILLLGKAIGGGMPLGAFISSKENMDLFTHNPILGHITTFGGHPVSCAAGLAAFQFLLKHKLSDAALRKEKYFIQELQHPAILKINSCGLLMAVHFESYELNKKIIDTCISKGVFTDWFLFASNALRIVPPLTIEENEIKNASAIILEAINEVVC
ncbi:MAG TPA: aspartate aminotransferase family protein [Chitinophagaceae bacterium]|nr:aspartate aminotransferase family protein [Chitinophagaceae bacterium]